MSYKIQVMSDAEFEALPYPETETSLGIADPATNTAFVRYTHSDELNKYLINHELDHLIEGAGGEHSDHYRNGVYYKGIGNILGPVAPFLNFVPGVGPLLSAVASMGAGYMSQREQARAQKKQAEETQRQFTSAQPFGQFNVSQPTSAFPSQTFTGSPSIINTENQGAGGSGALGNLTGTAVDRLRQSLQGNQGNFSRGFYAGRFPQ